MSTNNSRTPPHSVEAEESVLGAILLDNDCINFALDKVKADDFYRAAHKQIFQSMTELADRIEPIDIITLSQALRDKAVLDQCGGIEYLSRLSSLVPSSASINHYAKLVKDMSVRRKLIHEASGIINDAFKTDTELPDFLDQVEQKILRISDDRSGAGFTRVSDIVSDSISTIEQMYDRKDPITGVSTGFTDLNKLTAGFQKSDLIVIAARPAMGKTALALSMLQHIGIHDHHNAAMFSLEMSKEQLVLRLLCSEARVDSSKVRTGFLAERDFPRLVDAASKISEAPIYIDDTPALSVTDMRAKARRLHREAPLSLIVVDYLQLMKSPLYKNNREQEIADISRSLKSLAKELNVPILALGQLNRSVESRVDKRPMMSDLRESGAIEQDADIIMFIYRDVVYNPETEDQNVAELIIAKHRSGPTGTVRLAFTPEFTKFDNLAEHYEDKSEETQIQPMILESDFGDDML